MKTPSEVRAEVAPTVHRSRWGFHAVDYPTFLLLRRLSKAYWRALGAYAAWQRWQRKAPQNRVTRRTLRDAQGRRVGAEVVGPRPAPALDPLFTKRETATVHWQGGRHVPEGVQVEQVTFVGHGIPEALAAARMPAASPELVRPLALTAERIRELAALLGE